MWWPDDHVTVTTMAPSPLARLVRRAGVHPEYADDIGGAIATFCRARHGTDQLDDDYLLFLIERSGFRGDAPDTGSGSSRFIQALRASADPAALYEAHRRHLVRLIASEVFRGGCYVRVNLKKVAMRPREDLTLMWMPVFRRLAGWVGDWRAAGAGAIMVEGRAGTPRVWSELRENLVASIHHAGRVRGLAEATVWWAD